MTADGTLALVALLMQSASLDADLGVRSEARSTTLDARGLPSDTRASLSATPRAAVLAEVGRLRLDAAYAARLWTSDVEASSSGLVNHLLDVRAGTRREGTWRAEATASAVRGTTDPWADPWQAAEAAAGRVQVATTDPIRNEELRAGLGGELALDARTTVTALAGWQVSRAVDPADRNLLPLQRGASLGAGLGWLATERDTLNVAARAARTVTDAPGGAAPTSEQPGRPAASSTRASQLGGLATWRRRLTPRLGGWLGAGATLAATDPGAGEGSRDVLPAAEAGLARDGDGVSVPASVAGHLTTLVDRFTGEVHPLADVVVTVGWRVGERLALALSASGGARTDGATAFGGGDLRASWALRERLALEVGVTARWQRERRPELPSFFQGGAFAGVAYSSGPLFGTVPR